MAEEETPETESSPDARQEPEESVSAEAVNASASDEASGSDVETAAAPEGGEQESGAARQPAEVLAPKERKRRAKAAKGPRRLRTPEEREAARARKRALRREARTRLREKRRREPGGETEPSAAAQAEPRRMAAGRQKTRQGVVVSDRAAKTITVRIDTAHRHPRYEKIVRTSRTLHAHDERSEAHIGDTVIVRECRPLSRSKRWRLERVVERAG